MDRGETSTTVSSISKDDAGTVPEWKGRREVRSNGLTAMFDMIKGEADKTKPLRSGGNHAR